MGRKGEWGLLFLDEQGEPSILHPPMWAPAHTSRVSVVMVEIRAVGCYHTHLTDVGTEAHGVRGGAHGSNPVLRDSKARSEEDSRAAMALTQWFPNACNHEPLLGRTSISSRG